MKIMVFSRKVVMRTALVLCVALVAIAYVRISGAEPMAVWAPATKPLPVYSVARNDNVIAISFDAAWGDEKTEGILKILEDRDITSTFFLVSYWIDAYPDKVRQIANAGHEIGNHSNTHPHMSQLPASKMREELKICSDKVEAITGVPTTLFRCPYGDYNNTVINTAAAEGYDVIQWDVDSLDWKSLGVQPMIDQVLGKVKSGSIVLFHNNSDYILEALPTILDQLIAKGYRIVPVSELLLDGETYIDHAGCQYPQKAG